jgi:hypothetical protein
MNMVVIFNDVDWEHVLAVAKHRTGMHEEQDDRFIMCKDHDIIGVAGEQAFFQLTGLEPPMVEGHGGDGCIDFTSPSGVTIDVKTASKPYGLLVPTDQVFADVYVLALYKPKRIEFVGWKYGKDVIRYPTIQA